jgi:hypothetical protein
MRAVLALLVLTSTARAQVHLVYAVEFTAAPAGKPPVGYVRLGCFTMESDGSGRTEYVTFGENRKPTDTTTRYPNFSGGKVTPGFVQTPTPTNEVDAPMRWTKDGLVYRFAVGASAWEWVDVGGWYQPRGPPRDARGASTISGVAYSAAYGWGYLSDEASRSADILPDFLLPAYSGEQYTRTVDGTPRWYVQPSGWRVSSFQRYGNDLGLSWDSTQLKGVKVYSAFLFNRHANKLLIDDSGGHDYNRNLAADEYGHTSLLRCVADGRAAKVLGVECSYQNNGHPILSLLRYYAP